ncbi:Cupin 2 conserved barrel domain protein [Methylobacterium sp. 4-46]|uniref:cupin domain-containing protein n=1 Tax=unclassified Methylobacterium TaxID=2615210 RepID=UPI000152CF17|nr:MULTISPECIES: cupin domain-containing protein [Methylobacterium]ACA17225.1 Cupin 2 conserved barrel domain protein [Methylobacterium sp. 4-46]WFT82907.1 cupin domain-containing protein [Methylobacterium nodulans]
MHAVPVIHLPDEAPRLTVAGHPMAVLVTARESRYACMFDWVVPPRFSTGLHVHRVQEETFYVLDGACEWQVEDRVVTARRGAYLFIPPGVPHDIRNPSAVPARLLMTVSPPGHEAYFEELAGLAGSGPPDPRTLAALRRRFDTDQLSSLTVTG